MVKSMFSAVAGLQSHQSKMDVIGNNIANVNTWGYKTRSANFQDVMYHNIQNSSVGRDEEGGTGGTNASQLGYGSTIGSITTNFGVGSRAYTGNGMNAMIDGNGFFVVGPMKGDTAVTLDNLGESGLMLSRVGIFTFDGNGYLVDSAGNYVYEVDGNNVQAIRIPESATAGEREKIQTVSIGKDGKIVGVNEKGEKVDIGQIGIATVENQNGLVQSAGYCYTMGDNVGQVSMEIAGQGGVGSILSNYLEMSNANLSSDIADMITTQRGYQANSKMITATDEMLEQLVNMKR